MLDDIDKHTRVLEPERPTRSALFRKLALPVPHAFVQLTVLPALPRAVPQLRWYGNESVVAPLRESLRKNLGRWYVLLPCVEIPGYVYPCVTLTNRDEKALVRTNLERLMEITFPSPKAAWKEVHLLWSAILFRFPPSSVLFLLRFSDYFPFIYFSFFISIS